MAAQHKKERHLSRRNMLPILGSAFLIPFLGFGNAEKSKDEKEEHQTLLKPDGSVVKVKISVLKKSKVIEKRISNKSLLNWLNKK